MNPKSIRDYWRTTWRFAAWNIFGKITDEEPPYLVRKIKTVDIDVLPARHMKSPVHKWASWIRNFLNMKADFDPAMPDRATAMVDGDRCGSTPMHIEIVPNAVQLIVPSVKVSPVPSDVKQLDKVVSQAA